MSWYWNESKTFNCDPRILLFESKSVKHDVTISQTSHEQKSTFTRKIQRCRSSETNQLHSSLCAHRLAFHRCCLIAQPARKSAFCRTLDCATTLEVVGSNGQSTVPLARRELQRVVDAQNLIEVAACKQTRNRTRSATIGTNNITRTINMLQRAANIARHNTTRHDTTQYDTTQRTN